MEPEELKKIKKVLRGWYFDPTKKGVQFKLFDRLSSRIKVGIDIQDDPGPLIFSYAASGRDGAIDIVDEHLKTLENTPEYTEALNLAAQGYAASGNHEKVKEYQDKGADPAAIAVGYVLSKNEAKVAEYQKAYGVDPASITVAYILSGDFETGKKYSEQNKVEDHWLALAYSLRAPKGYKAKLKEFIEDYKYKSDSKALTYIAFAAGLLKQENITGVGGSISDFEPQEAKEAYIQGCILAGFNEHIDLDLADYEVSEAASKAYSLEGQTLTSIVLKYLSMRTEEREPSKKPTEKGPTKKYLHFSPFGFGFFQHSFEHKSKAVCDLVAALNGKSDINLKKHLSTLRNGRLGEEIRQFVRAGKANDIVGCKVKTVTQFVNALHEKSAQKDQFQYKL